MNYLDRLTPALQVLIALVNEIPLLYLPTIKKLTTFQHGTRRYIILRDILVSRYVSTTVQRKKIILGICLVISHYQTYNLVSKNFSTHEQQ